MKPESTRLAAHCPDPLPVKNTFDRDTALHHLSRPDEVVHLVRTIAYELGWDHPRRCFLDLATRDPAVARVRDEDPALVRRTQRYRHPAGHYFDEVHHLCPAEVRPARMTPPKPHLLQAAGPDVVDILYRGLAIGGYCPAHGHQTLGLRRWREPLDLSEGWMRGRQSLDIALLVRLEHTSATSMLHDIVRASRHVAAHAWVIAHTFELPPFQAALLRREGVVVLSLTHDLFTPPSSKDRTL